MNPRPTTIAELLDHHDGVLLDAYGVLVDGSGALPGARPLFAELERRRKPYAIVTNDASRSQETYARRFAGYGITIAPERFVTSGSLLPAYIRALGTPRTLVLGTEDSFAFVRAGGGIPVEVRAGIELDAVAICDDSGTPFVEGIEVALSAIVRAVDAGRRPALVLPNPDLVFPKGGGELGFTAGAMALLVEAALARRFPTANLVFERLGKPEPHLFRAAATQLGIAPERLVMIGDQLETDIAGAHAAGIPAALLAGVSKWDARAALAPTYLLATIEP
ncbi:MAG TPA: HAD-IA family hydrolase [Kofleriaceae bacterium]|nr:HAD-IA family hydrolase [Kofleriaceae bacterium]